MLLLLEHRLDSRDATVAGADSTGEQLDNIYTDSNDDGATVHGQSVHHDASLKDKIIAFGSVAVFIVAFIIYLYFYISPIVRAKRNARRLKRLTNSSGSPLVEKIGLPTREGSFSFTFVDRSACPSTSTPERPRRIVYRDSVGLTRSKRDASIFDLEPFLDSFPLPPARDSLSPCADYTRSPPTPTPKGCGSAVFSPPPQYLTIENVPEKASPAEVPFVGLPSLQKLAPIVILSGSLDDMSHGKVLVSPNDNTEANDARQSDPHTEHASLLATFPPREPVAILNPLNIPRGRGQPGICSQSPLANAHSSPPTATTLLINTRSAPAIRGAPIQKSPHIRKSTSHLKELRLKGANEGPVYADIILPGYCRSQSQADALRLHSHKIRDSVFVRAANYAQKLVSPSSPPKENTELHFEMVKGGHDV